MKIFRVLVLTAVLVAFMKVGEARMEGKGSLVVPPMDLSQADRFETATFAMG
ncbi:MAG TPA: hypothetical protein PLS21_07295 [Synergistales bacterium]|nr:MAG: hypothetical protein XD83_0268 [Synergistales bacterium 57_84]KUK88780.1 MAG: hypothetical protein XE01_0312 [Synergistales bacterium 58_81]HQO83782.1 hypothetical protein [Synergistales bacterium]HQQ10191.1 hypothetical protein [Synergistales bacterium]